MVEKKNREITLGQIRNTQRFKLHRFFSFPFNRGELFLAQTSPNISKDIFYLPNPECSNEEYDMIASKSGNSLLKNIE